MYLSESLTRVLENFDASKPMLFVSLSCLWSVGWFWGTGIILQLPFVCHQVREGTVPSAKDDLWKFSQANFESAKIWPFLSMGNTGVIIKNQNKAPHSLCSCFFCIRGVKAIPWSVHMAEKCLHSSNIKHLKIGNFIVVPWELYRPHPSNKNYWYSGLHCKIMSDWLEFKLLSPI